LYVLRHTINGLRDYGIEAQVWGGLTKCDHEWDTRTVKARIGTGGNWQQGENGEGLRTGVPQTRFRGDCRVANEAEEREIATGFCRHCGAWRGSLGLEPSLSLYLDHMVEVCREIRRVLRKDGTFWLNIGDSYCSTNKWGGGKNGNSGKHTVADDGEVPSWAVRERKPSQSGLKSKDLMMVPARLAIRLQEDGWYLRSDIIWAKTSPMPESVTDRPTSAHEHIFLLTRSPKYYYDNEAAKEDAVAASASRYNYAFSGAPDGLARPDGGERLRPEGIREFDSKRNMRNFMLLGPEMFPDAHFAVYPTAIPRIAILAGTSERGVCPKCAAPYARVVDKRFTRQADVSEARGVRGAFEQKPMDGSNSWEGFPRGSTETQTIGWRATCHCDAGEPMPATVLDPFAGAFTTCLVSERLQRNSIGIELNPTYCEMGRKRLAEDASLFFAETPAELRGEDESPRQAMLL
jgi:DNA modification methylase